jgi:hypothetical protein
VTTPVGPLRALARSRTVHARSLLAAFAVGSLVVAVAGYRARHILSNIDGISYISIARQYAHGQLDTAINGYWSPLISWMLAPFIAVGIDGQLAFMIVNVVAAVVGTGLGSLLVWRTTRGHLFATAVFMFTSFVFYAGNLPTLTPDLLVVTWVIVFVYTLTVLAHRLDPGTTRQRILGGALLGVICALGYFTKLFLMPVFVLVIIVVLVVRARGHVRPAFVTMGSAAVVVALVIAPWSMVLSNAYGTFTLGTSFTVNVESKFEPAIEEDAVPTTVLSTPPNENAISFGEDRTQQVVGTGFTSRSGFLARLDYYVSNRIDAFPAYIAKIGSIAPFAVITIAMLILGLLFGVVSYRRNRAAALASVTVVAYFLGYAAITSLASGGGNARYYWPIFILSVLVLCLSVPAVLRRLHAPRLPLKRLMTIGLVLLVPFAAVWQHGLGNSAPFSGVAAPSGLGYIKNDAKPELQTFAEGELSAVIPPGSSIVGKNYRQTLKYAFYLDDVQIFGRSTEKYDPTNPVFQDELRAKGIDYYLMYGPVDREPVGLSALGETVATFYLNSTCFETTPTVKPSCRLDVIQVSP